MTTSILYALTALMFGITSILKARRGDDSAVTISLTAVFVCLSMMTLGDQSPKNVNPAAAPDAKTAPKN